MTKKTQKLIEHFIEQKGMEYQAEGLPRIAGRLMGLMLIEETPISFSQLAEALQVSRGSISTNTRLLENLGVIERVSKPGNRGDYFQLSPDPYASLLSGLNLRLKRSLATARQTRENLPQDWKDAQKRLSQLEAFYAGFLQSTSQLLKKFEENANR